MIEETIKIVAHEIYPYGESGEAKNIDNKEDNI